MTSDEWNKGMCVTKMFLPHSPNKSITVERIINLTKLGGLAQLVEHLLCKQGVIGSSPLSSTIDISPHHRLIDNVKKRSTL